MAISNRRKPTSDNALDITLSVYGKKMAVKCKECTSEEYIIGDIYVIHQDLEEIKRGTVVAKAYCLHCHNDFYFQFSVKKILDGLQ